MRKSIARVTSFMMLTLVLAACGGDGQGGVAVIATNPKDGITVDSVTPSVVSAGTSTTFNISVSYSLQTKDSGVIRYGFKSDSSNSYPLEAEEKIVSKGTGTALFTATKTLTEATTLRVQLSIYPTPQQYSPLVMSSQSIIVN